METRHESEPQRIEAPKVMNLTVNRLRNNGDTTIGELLINGLKYCDTLEDEPRDVKVKHETRIPAGKYKVTLRDVGGFHNRYLNRYGSEWHKGMLWVRDVPEFEYILIHAGNDDEDTSGCLLVGTAPDKGWSVWSSRTAYERIYPTIRDALLEGKDVYITYYDKDTNSPRT